MQNSQSLAYLSDLLPFQGQEGSLALFLSSSTLLVPCDPKAEFPWLQCPSQLSQHSGPGSLQGSSAPLAGSLHG